MDKALAIDVVKTLEKTKRSFDIKIQHYTDEELKRLTQHFREYCMKKPGKRIKYLLVFLFLRHTGARLSEVLAIDEKRDIDFQNSTVTLLCLKRKKKKNTYRMVPIPDRLITEYLLITKQYNIEGKAFKIFPNNFFILYRKVCELAGIPEHLSHPHVLRHTRAVELIRAGVPVTAVQSLLGHSSIVTTAKYLTYTNAEIKSILKEKNII